MNILGTAGIGWIWHYQRVTIKRRAKVGLPTLYDNNDLPDPYYDRNYVRVLSDKEQEDLHYRECHKHICGKFTVERPCLPIPEQHKFMQSMTWYRPHGTFTHRVRHSFCFHR